jgi:hypothetical protein
VGSTPAPRSGRVPAKLHCSGNRLAFPFFSEFIDEIDCQFRLLHLVPSCLPRRLSKLVGLFSIRLAPVNRYILFSLNQIKFSSFSLRFDPLALDRPIQLGHRGGVCCIKGQITCYAKAGKKVIFIFYLFFFWGLRRRKESKAFEYFIGLLSALNSAKGKWPGE